MSDEVYALSAHEGVMEERGEPFVSALALLGDNENENSTVNGEETTENAAIDKEVDQSLVHVIWSLSKDLGSSGIRIVRSGPLMRCRFSSPTFSQLLRSLLSLLAHSLPRTIRLV